MAELKYQRWKIPFSLNNKTPTVVLESLYDLAFDKDGNERYSPGSDAIDGYNLKHDIICYNPSLYNTEGVPSDTQFDNWHIYGMDLSLPKFDNRAKPKILTPSYGVTNSFSKSIDVDINEIKADLNYFDFNSNTWGLLYKILNPNASPPSIGVVIQDKDSALFPNSTYDLIENSTNFDESKKGQAPGVQFSGYYDTPFTVCINSNLEGINPDIILLNKDVVFDNTLQSKNMNGYTNMCLNTMSPAISNLFKRAMHLNDNETDFVKLIKEHPFITWVAKNTYIWVRCLFWADYVNPLSFEQDLNRGSSVVHSNLLISRYADFNKYNIKEDIKQGTEGVTDPIYKSENTRAYIPQTAPVEDLLSETLLTLDSKENIIDSSWEDKINILIESSSNPDSIIGSLRTDVIDKQSALSEKKPFETVPPIYKELTPPPFFDSESRKRLTDSNNQSYTLSPGKDIMPIIVPKEGNVYIDGRIFSPSIDELWIYLKKLVSGRDIDSKLTTGNIKDPYSRATVLSTTTIDNRIEVKDISFVKKSNNLSIIGIGDPLQNKIVEDKLNGDYLEILNWISSPTEIMYNIYKNLYDLDVILIGKEFPNIVKEKYYQRTIRKFTALNKNGEPIQVPTGWIGQLPAAGDMAVAGLPIENTANDPIYGLRPNPYSLRELETYVKGLRFNLETLANYIAANFVLSGVLARENTTQNTSAGGLYQLHKDYDGNINNPNTLFDKNKVEQTHNVKFELEEERNAYHNTTTTTIAISEENYKNNHITNNTITSIGNSISTQDVYLAADGNWRYLFDSVSLPITYSEF
jgi:hypothetical protein